MATARSAGVGERFVVHPVRAFWSGTALVGVVGLMAILVPAAPLAVEQQWAEAMRDIQTPLLKDLALIFNALGHGVWRALTVAAVGIVLLVARRWLALACFALVESLTPLFSSLLKAMVGRERPPDPLVHPAGSSFPSGHAAYAGATCIALVLLFTMAGPRRRWWWALAALGIVGMAWSRTYLQVHWLSDVVGGSLLGIGVSFLVFGGAHCLGLAGSPRGFGPQSSWRTRFSRRRTRRKPSTVRSTAPPAANSPYLLNAPAAASPR